MFHVPKGISRACVLGFAVLATLFCVVPGRATKPSQTQQAFTLSAPSSMTVTAGQNASSSIAVSETGGTFNVSLSVSGTPGGATASLQPASTSSKSTLTIQTASTTTPGTYSLTVTGSANGLTQSAMISLKVSTPPTVTSVLVTASPASITMGQTATCTATVSGTGSYSTAVTWTATDGSIKSAGVFTPSAAGTGTCTAASTQSGYTNVSGSASITVAAIPTITSIAVTASPTTITTAQTAQCSANVSGTGSYSSAVTWTSTDGNITSTGLFTPLSVKTATCTAHSAVTGYTKIAGSASITVTAVPPTITGVTLICSPTIITMGQTATCTPTVTGTGSFTNTVNLSFSPAAGSLSASSGVASGKAVSFFPPATAETATITAVSTQDSTKTASAAISVLTAYQVNLTWNAPADATVVGYYVYRAPTGTTLYQPLNAVAVTPTAFTDGSVQNGATYDYVVYSVNAWGATSVASDTFTTTIPQS